MLAVAAINDYELDGMDVTTAFLNGKLEDNVYLNIPDGFPQKPGYVLRLKRALYGLRESPRIWNHTLHDFLIKCGLRQSHVDECLYYIPGKLWIVVWVDDFLVMSPDRQLLNKFKADLKERFPAKDMGPARAFLGLEIQRDRKARTLTISAPSYVVDMLARFGMANCKGATAPLPHKIDLRPTDPDEPALPKSSYPYRELIGSLNYLAMVLRADIAFAVSYLARFQQHPSIHHWDAAKHVLRYLQATKDFGLTYSTKSATVNLSDDGGIPSQTRRPPDELYAYADASWADDPVERRSQSGYIFMYANAAVSWSTRRQDVVALSSTEAEYISLSATTKTALALRTLMAELTSAPPQPVVILEDNQSTIKLALKQTSSERTKHIDVRHHFVKQCVAKGSISLVYVPTAFQAADCLTKSLDKVKTTLFRQIILGS
jgi:hypothetical protein